MSEAPAPRGSDGWSSVLQYISQDAPIPQHLYSEVGQLADGRWACFGEGGVISEARGKELLDRISKNKPLEGGTRATQFAAMVRQGSTVAEASRRAGYTLPAGAAQRPGLVPETKGKAPFRGAPRCRSRGAQKQIDSQKKGKGKRSPPTSQKPVVLNLEKSLPDYSMPAPKEEPIRQTENCQEQGPSEGQQYWSQGPSASSSSRISPAYSPVESLQDAWLKQNIALQEGEAGKEELDKLTRRMEELSKRISTADGTTSFSEEDREAAVESLRLREAHVMRQQLRQSTDLEKLNSQDAGVVSSPDGYLPGPVATPAVYANLTAQRARGQVLAAQHLLKQQEIKKQDINDSQQELLTAGSGQDSVTQASKPKPKKKKKSQGAAAKSSFQTSKAEVPATRLPDQAFVMRMPKCRYLVQLSLSRLVIAPLAVLLTGLLACLYPLKWEAALPAFVTFAMIILGLQTYLRHGLCSMWIKRGGDGSGGVFGFTIEQPNSGSIEEFCKPVVAPKEDSIVAWAINAAVETGFASTWRYHAAIGNHWVGAPGNHPPAMCSFENYYSFFEGDVGIPPNSNVPADVCTEWWHLNMIRDVAQAQKVVQVATPVENPVPLPEISSILEGIDELVPSKEYRSWISAVDVIVNCPSYQYFLSYLYVLVGKTQRRTSNIKLYVVGWLYVIMAWSTDIFIASGLAPAGNVPLPGAPGIVCHTCTRAPVAGAGSAWLENNAAAVARGDAYFFSAASMTASEVRAVAALYQPFPQVYPNWQDGTGRAYALPCSMLRIAGSYDVGCFFPLATPAVVLAGGFAQMAQPPEARVMMSGMWKLAFNNAEGPLILVAFVIAAQMACGVRRWFTSAQEWRHLTLPRPDSSQFLRGAIAALDGKTSSGMPINPFLGLAFEICLSSWLIIGLTFQVAGSYVKYWMSAVRNCLHSDAAGRLYQNVRNAALGNSLRALGTTTPWRLGLGSAYKKLFGLAPQLIVLQQPGIPSDDTEDSNVAPNRSWSSFSVRGIGFFPVKSLFIYSLLESFPPTMSLIRRNLTKVGLRNLVTTYVLATTLAAAFIPAFEQDPDGIILGMVLASYVQAVVFLDYLMFNRRWSTTQWIYRKDGSKKTFIVNLQALDQVQLVSSKETTLAWLKKDHLDHGLLTVD